jgi:Tfp pilus assembly protein PilO
MKILSPILFLAISLTLFFGFIDPSYTRVKELRSEESQYDIALDRSKELQQIRDQLLSKYNTVSPTSLERIEKLVPDHIDNVRLILDLDEIASKYGMRVRDVQIEADNGRQVQGQIGPNEGLYESVVLSFSVAGTYDTFRSFLTDIERSLRVVDVVGLSFRANETGIYDYTIHIKTYWLKP